MLNYAKTCSLCFLARRASATLVYVCCLATGAAEESWDDPVRLFGGGLPGEKPRRSVSTRPTSSENVKQPIRAERLSEKEAILARWHGTSRYYGDAAYSEIVYKLVVNLKDVIQDCTEVSDVNPGHEFFVTTEFHNVENGCWIYPCLFDPESGTNQLNFESSMSWGIHASGYLPTTQTSITAIGILCDHNSSEQQIQSAVTAMIDDDAGIVLCEDNGIYATGQAMDYNYECEPGDNFGWFNNVERGVDFSSQLPACELPQGPGDGYYWGGSIDLSIVSEGGRGLACPLCISQCGVVPYGTRFAFPLTTDDPGYAEAPAVPGLADIENNKKVRMFLRAIVLHKILLAICPPPTPTPDPTGTPPTPTPEPEETDEHTPTPTSSTKSTATQTNTTTPSPTTATPTPTGTGTGTATATATPVPADWDDCCEIELDSGETLHGVKVSGSDRCMICLDPIPDFPGVCPGGWIPVDGLPCEGDALETTGGAYSDQEVVRDISVRVEEAPMFRLIADPLATLSAASANAQPLVLSLPRSQTITLPPPSISTFWKNIFTAAICLGTILLTLRWIFGGNGNA